MRRKEWGPRGTPRPAPSEGGGSCGVPTGASVRPSRGGEGSKGVGGSGRWGGVSDFVGLILAFRGGASVQARQAYANFQAEFARPKRRRARRGSAGGRQQQQRAGRRSASEEEGEEGEEDEDEDAVEEETPEETEADADTIGEDSGIANRSNFQAPPLKAPI